MFTNNYINFRKGAFLATGSSSSEMYKIINSGGTEKSVFSSYGVQCDLGGWMSNGRCRALVTDKATSRSSAYPGVYFGTGSTPANKSDYKLESLIESGLQITSPSSAVWTDEGNGKYSIAADFVVRNTTESEINIYEIGIFTPVSNGTSEFYQVLMERTVLAEPITIAPGEPKLVTYKITFNQTLNVE